MSHSRNFSLSVSMQRSVDRAQGHIASGDWAAAKLETEVVSDLGQALSEHCHNALQALYEIRACINGAGEFSMTTSGALTAKQKLERIQDVLESLTPPL